MTSESQDCIVCRQPAKMEPIENGTRLSVDCENEKCRGHIIALEDWDLVEEWIAAKLGRQSLLMMAITQRPHGDVPTLNSELLEKLSS